MPRIKRHCKAAITPEYSDGTFFALGMGRWVVSVLSEGIIFDIMRYSLHDGPGIRTVVFMKGCPLDCWWCHNPEGKTARQEVMFWPDRCVRCGRCLEACSAGAIDPETLFPRDGCRACGDCVKVCYRDARVLVGRWVGVRELILEVEKDVIFYDQSGGGVTFSGGEPLAQPGFLVEVLKECRARRIHTAVETSGYAAPEVLRSVGRHVNLFLFDLKMMDEARHKRFTGVSNALILDNLRLASTLGTEVIVRVPVIPGINDLEEDIARAAEFVSSLETVEEVHLLPYHSMGADKNTRLNREYRVDARSPSEEELLTFAEVFRKAGLRCHIGG